MIFLKISSKPVYIVKGDFISIVGEESADKEVITFGLGKRNLREKRPSPSAGNTICYESSGDRKSY